MRSHTFAIATPSGSSSNAFGSHSILKATTVASECTPAGHGDSELCTTDTAAQHTVTCSEQGADHTANRRPSARCMLAPLLHCNDNNHERMHCSPLSVRDARVQLIFCSRPKFESVMHPAADTRSSLPLQFYA